MPKHSKSKTTKVYANHPAVRSGHATQLRMPKNTYKVDCPPLNPNYDEAKTRELIKHQEAITGRPCEFLLQDGTLRPLIKGAFGHDEPLPFNKALPRNSFNYSILPMSKEIERQTGVSASAIYREFLDNTTAGEHKVNARNLRGFWATAWEVLGVAGDGMVVVGHRPQPDAYLGGCYANAWREHRRTGNEVIIGAQFNAFTNTLASISPHAVNRDIKTGEFYDTATNDIYAREGHMRCFIPRMSAANSLSWVEDLMAKRPQPDLGETIGFYEFITLKDTLFVLPSFEPKRGQDLSMERWGKVKVIDLSGISNAPPGVEEMD